MEPLKIPLSPRNQVGQPDGPRLSISNTPKNFSNILRHYPPSLPKPKKQLAQIVTPESDRSAALKGMRPLISPHVILYDGSITAPQSDRGNRTFVSFHTMLVNKVNTSVNKDKDDSFFAPFTTREGLNKQLAFNKKQEEMFRKTIQKDTKELYQNFQALLKDKNKKKMPKITVHPSVSFQGFKLTGDNASTQSEQNNDEEKKENVEISGSSSWIKLDVNSCNWYWYLAQLESIYEPASREGAAFVSIGRFGYLYGGISRELHNQIEVLDTGKWEWSQPRQTGDIPEQGRQGHSIDYYEKTLILFGGAMCYNSNLRIRECLNEVRSFNLEKNEWKYVKCTGEFVLPRRNHASVVVGKHLLVYGGIDGSGNYLNDLKVLDLVRNEWKDETVETHVGGGVAFHRGCVVVVSNKIKISLFKLQEPKIDKHNTPKIQEEGIYFFGGKTQEDELSGTLRILKIGQKNLSWVIPKTQGTPPGPRCFHTMVHCPTMNILVVCGGRNDYLFSRGKSPLVEDLYVLELEKMTWFNVPTSGMGPSPRCSHLAGVFGTKMLVFGGINMGQYCPFNIHVLEMNPLVAKKLKIQHNIEKQRTLGILPAVSSPNKKPQDESFTKLESEAKKEYTGIVTYLPVMSKRQLEKKRQDGLDIQGELRSIVGGSGNSNRNSTALTSTASLALRVRSSLFKTAS